MAGQSVQCPGIEWLLLHMHIDIKSGKTKAKTPTLESIHPIYPAIHILLTLCLLSLFQTEHVPFVFCIHSGGAWGPVENI